jgi:hypothetical protein|nr:MAG TPA: peptidase [Caudoviricetes sp.]
MTSTELQALKQSILDEVRVMMQTTGQVTQYIGARYVPLIADPIEWSDQKEYEPLTIVTNQGNSYTSRQFIPKGTPITNEQFWAVTGNFNAQIEQYRQEVTKFDARITAAQNAADSKAPANHASDSTEYGIGNEMNYGHVKLSDDTGSRDNANSGIAATPKMVADFLLDAAVVIDVTKYGVIADGETDNTPVVNELLKKTSKTGKVLFFPKGIYKFDDTIVMPSQTTIIGAGMSVKDADFSGGTTFLFTKTDRSGIKTTEQYCMDVNVFNLCVINITNKNSYVNMVESAKNYSKNCNGIEIKANAFNVQNVRAEYFYYGIYFPAIPAGEIYDKHVLNAEGKYANTLNAWHCQTGIVSLIADFDMGSAVCAECYKGVHLNGCTAQHVHVWSIANIGCDLYDCRIHNLILDGIGQDGFDPSEYANYITLHYECHINNLIIMYVGNTPVNAGVGLIYADEETSFINNTWVNYAPGCPKDLSPILIASARDDIAAIVMNNVYMDKEFTDFSTRGGNNVVMNIYGNNNKFNGKQAYKYLANKPYTSAALVEINI